MSSSAAKPNVPGGLPGNRGGSSVGDLALGAGADRRRWLILLIVLIAMTAGCPFQYGIAYLIPALRHDGFSLVRAGFLVACPTIGLLLTLIGWGAVADRRGERLGLASGLSAAGAVLLAGGSVHGHGRLAGRLRLAGAAGGPGVAGRGALSLRRVGRHA